MENNTKSTESDDPHKSSGQKLSKSKSDQFFKATMLGRFRIVHGYLDSGFDPNTKDENLQTALMKTVYLAKEDVRGLMARMLFKSGAVADLVDAKGMTALMHACSLPNAIDMVRRIITMGNPDPNTRDDSGSTALMHAVLADNPRAIRYLINASYTKHTIHIDRADYQGFTPLMRAVERGYGICCKVLVHEAKANTQLVSDKEVLHTLLEANKDEYKTVEPYRELSRQSRASIDVTVLAGNVTGTTALIEPSANPMKHMRCKSTSHKLEVSNYTPTMSKETTGGLLNTIQQYSLSPRGTTSENVIFTDLLLHSQDKDVKQSLSRRGSSVSLGEISNTYLPAVSKSLTCGASSQPILNNQPSNILTENSNHEPTVFNHLVQSSTSGPRSKSRLLSRRSVPTISLSSLTAHNNKNGAQEKVKDKMSPNSYEFTSLDDIG